MQRGTSRHTTHLGAIGADSKVVDKAAGLGIAGRRVQTDSRLVFSVDNNIAGAAIELTLVGRPDLKGKES